MMIHQGSHTLWQLWTHALCRNMRSIQAGCDAVSATRLRACHSEARVLITFCDRAGAIHEEDQRQCRRLRACCCCEALEGHIQLVLARPLPGHVPGCQCLQLQVKKAAEPL